jgi:hypothetical protein
MVSGVLAHYGSVTESVKSLGLYVRAVRGGS